MKKLILLLTALTVLSTVAIAGAHMYGWGPSWMMGWGPSMMSWTGGTCYGAYGYNQKFLDETKELRKKLNDKRFEYFEALRNPKTSPETIEKLQKEIFELQQKILKKAPATTFRGYGPNVCWLY